MNISISKAAASVAGKWARALKEEANQTESDSDHSELQLPEEVLSVYGIFSVLVLHNDKKRLFYF